MYGGGLMRKLKRQSETVKDKVETKRKKKNDGDHGENETACKNQNASKNKVRLSTHLFNEDCDIHHSQIHNLLKYAVFGKCPDADQTSWCHIHHQSHLAGVVVIVLRDVSQVHFYRFYLQFKFLKRTFRHRFSLPPPCPKFLSSLFGENQITNRDKERSKISGKDAPLKGKDRPASDENTSVTLKPVVHKYGKDKCGLTRYLLSVEEMEKHDYPFMGLPDCVNYVSTDCSNSVTDNSPLFGLDCEMCLTGSGSELTRVSLVDADGNCVIDELVKPKNTILDYLTSFSGITEKILGPVTTRLQDIQFKLKAYLPPDAVLVGHSLNNDLRALQMIHPNVIDTSLLYRRKGGRRFKLKCLAEAVLGRVIQSEQMTGHDPEEDAKAALELAQYLIRHGPSKVDELKLYQEVKLPVANGATASTADRTLPLTDDTGFLTAEQNGFSDELDGHQSLLEMFHSTGKQCVLLTGTDEGKELASPSNSQHFTCTSNKKIIHRARQEVPRSSLCIVEFSLGSENVETAITKQIHAKLRLQLAEMLTVYAGPFNEPFSLQSVKDVFAMCGPIHSISIVDATQQLFVCIQYEVLEAAQLAVEVLDRSCVKGSYIKVQRPIKETTLDCETILKEMDGDIETEKIIYVNGIEKSETEKDLQRRFSHLKGIEHIFLPMDCKSGKNRKYCFIKFFNYASALMALTTIKETFKGQLKARKAVTPRHFHDWTLHQHTASAQGKTRQDISSSEQEVKLSMRKIDKTVKRLYKSLPSNTLCLVLMPGMNSSYQSFSGFGLMGITEKEDTPSGP